MRNLAGNQDCDKYIREELEAAGIPVVALPRRSDREVPALLEGCLIPYRFVRAWYYWVVSGPVPLAVAEEMYADPEGRKSVRVDGHCGCPPPADWARPINPASGRRVFPESEVAKQPELIQESLRNCEHVMEDVSELPFGITCYHIDAQAGLNLFVATVRKHKLTWERLYKAVPTV